MENEKKEEMTIENLKITAFRFITKQGFSISLMFMGLLALWFSNSENSHELKQQIKEQEIRMDAQIKTLESSVKDCNDYTRNTQENTIKENTEVMRQVLYELKDFNK